MASLIDACRSCDGARLEEILSLGTTPLANRLLTEEQLAETEPRFPLDLVFCPECSLTQITCTVSPEVLFRDYPYFSSVSETVVASASDLAARMIERESLGPDHLVLEIASNDGYLLQRYRQREIPVLGIEPARNVARLATENGVPTICEFFGRDLAARLAQEGRRADVVHANNVLAHVPDLNGVVAGIAAMLKESGVAVVEVPNVVDLVDRVEFDTIYHEHLCYFSFGALVALARHHGLVVCDVEHLPIHGGSLRVFLAVESGDRRPAASVAELLEAEHRRGADDLRFYGSFGRRVGDLGRRLRARLAELKDDGCRIAAYGASAKGSTLLNFLGIGREVLDFVVDRSPHKQGLFTPGTHLPILEPAELLERQPDVVLLLTWNFAEEILDQQAEYRRRGGRFLVPIPEVRLL